MAIMRNPFGDDETFAEASNPFWRFIFPTAFVIMLFAGGVYWIRQLPASPRSSESAGSIQVRLLQTPEATPMPLQAAERPTSPSVGVRSEQPREDSEQKAEDAPPSRPALATASIERAVAPNLSAIQTAASKPPSDTLVRFQQALMRHIERFERYPGAARRDRLQGTVQVAFVMGRDGKVLNAWVLSSSGQNVLDLEAIEALRRAEPLPNIPGELPGQLSVRMPVSFVPP